MKRVVNLIIAMERLSGSMWESLLSTEFRDENLLTIIMESLIEERTVFECYSVPVYNYERKELFSVTDSEKRILKVQVQSSDPELMELVAVMKQAGDGNREVHLNMSTYLDDKPLPKDQAVALSIKGEERYLSCHFEDGKATLHLEEVDDKSLSTISSDSDMVRFLFYKKGVGMENSSFSSVRFRDWFISTAEADDKKVEMCKRQGTERPGAGCQDPNRYGTFIIRAKSNTPIEECEPEDES